MRPSVQSAAALALIVAPAIAAAQNVTERSIEARTSLSFQVPTAAVQALLPSGWTVDPSNAAANRGANLNLTLMERLMVVDKQGAPVGTGTIRYVVVTAPARNAQTGQSGTLAIAGISPDSPGAYEVYVPATVSRVERTVESQADQPGRSRETWEFASANGERIELRLAYRRGRLAKSHAETVVRSGRHPGFQRTYHIDQAADVLRSAAAAEDRIDEIQFRASGGRFAGLFDGTEKLLSVTSLPWYARDITVP